MRCNRKTLAGCVLVCCWMSQFATRAVAADVAKKIVFLAGTKSHGPGHHEYERGLKLLAGCLERSPNLKQPFTTEVHLDGWPQNATTLDDAATIVMYCDGADHDRQAHPLLRGDRLDVLAKPMDRGCGLVAIHYTVFVPTEKGGNEFLRWIGGYFDYESGDGPRGWYSAIGTHETRPTPATPEHPISRGLQPFDLREEYYYRIRFPTDRTGWIPILTTPIPGDSESEVVAWALQRPSGGRGFGFTGGHFHDNWQLETFRRMVLNAIVWTAGMEVPPGGVKSTVPANEGSAAD